MWFSIRQSPSPIMSPFVCFTLASWTSYSSSNASPQSCLNASINACTPAKPSIWNAIIPGYFNGPLLYIILMSTNKSPTQRKLTKYVLNEWWMNKCVYEKDKEWLSGYVSKWKKAFLSWWWSWLMQIKLVGINTLTLLNLCRHIMPAFLCESKTEWIAQPEATGRRICHWSKKTISEEN